MQVVATVKASVSKDVFQDQLLQKDRMNQNRPQLGDVVLVHSPAQATPTSNIFFLLVTLFLSSFSGSGAARLTGGLKVTTDCH